MLTALNIGYGLVCGAFLGSFLACAAYRHPRRISLGGRSHCPACEARIGAHDNIPVLSWIALRGRARCCGDKISSRYAITEATWAAAGAVAGYLLGWKSVGLILLVVVLAVWLEFARIGRPEIRSRVEASVDLDDDRVASDPIRGGGGDGAVGLDEEDELAVTATDTDPR